jgi:hypothetical protein
LFAERAAQCHFDLSRCPFIGHVRRHSAHSSGHDALICINIRAMRAPLDVRQRLFARGRFNQLATR